MKRNAILIIGVCSILMSLYSCDTRREILDDESLWVRVHIDWSQAKMRPNGATVWFFPQDRPELAPIVLRTHATLDSLRLRRGTYSVLMFNDTEQDHSGMRFRGTDHYDTFEAYSEYITQRGQIAMLGDEPIAAIPEALATDHLDAFTITTGIVDVGQRPQIEFIPTNDLYMLNFSAHIIGLDNVVLAASYATISGMSGGMFLVSKERNKESVTHRFEFTSRTWDEGSYKAGTLYSNFLLFGVSGKWTRQGEGVNSKVTLHLKLRDGSSMIVERDVSQLIRQDSSLKLDLQLDMGLGNSESDPEILVPDVPDVDPGADSGFDANVNDWGDETVIEIPSL